MAAHRALAITEILQLILEQLHSDAIGVYDYFSMDEWTRDLQPSDDDAQAGLNALCAAARVSPSWRDAAVPILWRKPKDEALDPAAVSDPERRTYLASCVREMNFGECEALWRTVAGKYCCDRLNGTTRSGLRFPKLEALLVSDQWCLRPNEEAWLRKQEHLLRLISPNLQMLKCAFTLSVARRLLAIQAKCFDQQAVSPGNPSAMPSKKGSSIERRKQHMKLRTLHLSAFPLNGENASPESQAALLAWFRQNWSTGHALISVTVHDIFSGAGAAQAFRHFSRCKGLKKLDMSSFERDRGCVQLLNEIRVLAKEQQEEEHHHRETLFPHLERLSITIDFVAAPQLLSLTPLLTSLSLEVINSGNNNNNNSNEFN
jgi:hypothetical protein